MMNTKSKLTLGLIIIIIILAGIYFLIPAFDKNPTGLNSEKIIELGKLDNITKIEIDSTAQQTVLEKAGDNWIITTEENQVANQFLIDNIFQVLIDNPEGTIISQNPEKAASFNLTEENSLKLKLFNQDELVLHLLIGKLNQTYTSTYIKKANSNNVLLIADNFANKLNQPDWKEPPPEPVAEDVPEIIE